jgi:hypothetical protein
MPTLRMVTVRTAVRTRRVFSFSLFGCLSRGRSRLLACFDQRRPPQVQSPTWLASDEGPGVTLDGSFGMRRLIPITEYADCIGLVPSAISQIAGERNRKFPRQFLVFTCVVLQKSARFRITRGPEAPSAQLIEGKADEVAESSCTENLGGVDPRINDVDERIRRDQQAKERGTKADQRCPF